MNTGWHVLFVRIVLALILVPASACNGGQTETAQEENVTEPEAVRADPKDPGPTDTGGEDAASLGEWQLHVADTEHIEAITGGISTYSSLEGFTFLIVNLRLSKANEGPGSLEIDLRKLAVLDSSGTVYLAEAMGPDTSSMYFFGPMIAGELPSKYSCASMLGGSCNPLIRGNATQEYSVSEGNKVTLKISGDEATTTAELMVDGPTDLGWQIAFYPPSDTKGLRLSWPGLPAIELP